MGRVVQENKLSHKATVLFWYKFTEKAKYILKSSNTSATRTEIIIILNNQKAGWSYWKGSHKTNVNRENQNSKIYPSSRKR